MKTDELIKALAADPVVEPPVERALWPALALGVALSALVFLALLGPRHDFAQAIETLRFAIKPLFPILLAASAAYVASILWRPGGSPPIWPLMLAPLALVLAVALELIALPRVAWGEAMLGANALKCLFFIPILSLAPLAAALVALKRGASTNPAATGAVAGLMAAGLGAALYAVHCPDDSPLFIAVWYVIASFIVAGAGALLGARVLRW
jgi:hypothetical protein